MDPRDFLIFLYRRLLVVLMITILGALLGLGYTLQFDQGKQSGLIFLTFGMEIPDGISAAYVVTSDGHNVVDHFTETVQGWFLNPAMDAEIDELAGTDVQLAVRKQEKQNLLIEAYVAMDGDVGQATQAVLTVLEDDIAAYNAATNGVFVLALSSVTESVITPKYALNGIVGALLAFVFINLFFLSFEYFQRRLSFPFQVERLVGAAPLITDEDGVMVVHLGRTTEHDLKKAIREQGGPFDYTLKF